MKDLDANRCGSTAGCSVRRSTSDEDRKEHGRRDDRGQRRPAALQLAKPEQQRDQERGKKAEAREVDRSWRPADPDGRGPGEGAYGDRGEDGDGHGHDEDPSPAEPGDEQTADERADGRARGDQHVEQPERRAAPIRRSHLAQQGNRARRDERASDRLKHPRQREHLEGHGRGRERRGQREAAHANEEYPAMTEPVPEAATCRERDRDRAEVERDEGSDRGRAHPELLHHAGQRDREHRGVEGHEDRPGRQSEHRAGHQAGLGARRCRLLGALVHNSRTKPVVPSSSSC